MEAFVRCWKAVYCFPMPKLNVPTSKKLVEVARLYRKHKVPGINLLKNYCLLNRYAKELEEAFNPWEEFQRSIKRNNAITGVSLEETVFNAVARILFIAFFSLKFLYPFFLKKQKIFHFLQKSLDLQMIL